MKNLVILISLLLTGAIGCHKDSVPNYPVDADLKKAFNFKVGSYWVYEDSISGRIDSFYVSENVAQNEFYSGTPSYTEDNIAISIKELNINSYSNDTLGWTLIYDRNWINLGELNLPNIKKGVLAYNPFSTYPYDTNLATHDAPNFTPIINVYNSYEINGQLFSNIEVVNCVLNLTAAQNYPLGTAYNSNNWFYLCPNVGFIKIVINQPQDSIYRVWLLQRFKVVQ